MARLPSALGPLCPPWGAVVVSAILGCQPTTLSDGMAQEITCSSCHGSPDNAAPPAAVHGPDETSYVGVGAHQAHVEKDTLAAPAPCTECHPVPATVQDGNHPTPKGRPAQVVPGSLSSRRGAKPAWDRTTALCSNNYCHGATLDGAATRPAPLWTKVDGTQKTCTSCHGNPPGGRHPAQTACESCHADVVGPGGVIKTPKLHVNGTVETSSHSPGYADPAVHGSDFNQGKLDCKLCHGPDLRGMPGVTSCDTCHTPNWRTNCYHCHGGAADPSGSPPLSLSGAVSTSDPGVGAHPAHRIGGRVGSAVACTECHAVPTDVLTPGHVDVPPADVVFGSLARTGGAQPQWDRSTLRCQSTYCHGATLSGAATRSAPLWTLVDATQLACTSCHGYPPAGSHPAASNCEGCHGAVVGPGGVILSLALHINGTIETNGHPTGYADPAQHGREAKFGVSNCRSCHGATLGGASGVPSCDSCHQAGWRTNCRYCHGGTDNQTGAPPVDLAGNAASSSVTVGTHTAHVSRVSHPAYACGVCHNAVTDVLTAGHMFDGTPGVSEVLFGGGPSPAGQYARPACNNLYCHGNGRTNGTAASFAAGTRYNCESCHPTAGLSTSHAAHLSFMD